MDDQYSCNICFREHSTSYDFKRHLFLKHSDLEVRAKYNRTMEEMVGPYALKRIREPLMTMIKNDKFMPLVTTLLSSRAPFDMTKLSRIFPIDSDLCSVNKQNRKNFFLQCRDLLLKLAWNKA